MNQVGIEKVLLGWESLHLGYEAPGKCVFNKPLTARNRPEASAIAGHMIPESQRGFVWSLRESTLHFDWLGIK